MIPYVFIELQFSFPFPHSVPKARLRDIMSGEQHYSSVLLYLCVNILKLLCKKYNISHMDADGLRRTRTHRACGGDPSSGVHSIQQSGDTKTFPSPTLNLTFLFSHRRYRHKTQVMEDGINRLLSWIKLLITPRWDHGYHFLSHTRQDVWLNTTRERLGATKIS